MNLDFNIENAVFSDDKTTFGVMTDNGLYINTTGRPLDPSDKAYQPHTMRCVRCGTVYKNVTLQTCPHPCPCGSIGFETVNEGEE